MESLEETSNVIENKNESNTPDAKEIVSNHKLDKIIGEMYNTLIYERSKRPEIFMIKYLCNQLSEEERKEYGIELTDKYTAPDIIPIVKFPILDSKSKIYKHLTRTTWNSIKYLKTSFGNTVSDMFNIEGQVYIPDPSAYDKYSSFITPFAEDINNKCNNSELPYSEINGLNSEIISILKENNLELNSTPKDLSARLTRNLKSYPFVKFCNPTMIKEISELLKASLLKLGYEVKSLDEVKKSIESSNSDVIDNLYSSLSYYIKNSNFSKTLSNTTEALINKQNPEILVLLNNQSHLEVYYFNSKVNLFSILNVINKFDVSILNANNSESDKYLDFENHKSFGYLSPDIKSLAYGLEINSIMDIKKLNKDFDLKRLTTYNNSTAEILNINKENGNLIIKSRSCLGTSLKTLLFYHSNLISIVSNTVSENILKNIGNDSIKTDNLHKERIQDAYIKVYDQFSTSTASNKLNFNSFFEDLISSNKIAYLIQYKYYHSFFYNYFAKILENPSDLDKNYFYNYSLENNYIKSFNYKSDNLTKCITSFNLEFHRLVKCYISKDYIDQTIHKVNDSDSNDVKAIINNISVEVREIEDLSVSGKSNSLIFSINSYEKLKETFTIFLERSKIIYMTIDNHFITDSTLGYLTNDLSTIGSGAKLVVHLRILNENILLNNKSKLGLCYSKVEENIYKIEFLSFGKFVCKLINNFVGLVDEVIESNILIEKEIENKKKSVDDNSDHLTMNS